MACLSPLGANVSVVTSRIAFIIAVALCARTARAAAQQSHTVHEVEPNESPATATHAAVGDTLAGVVNQNGDSDWFAIDVPAGRMINFRRLPSTASLDIALLDTDGRTFLAGGGAEGGGGGSSTITYPITVAGRYFYVVSGNQGAGSPSWTYSIAVTDAPLTLGAGDPARTVATLDGSIAAVATRSGDFFILSWYGAVQRVTTSGTKTNFAALPRDGHTYATGGLALDEFDNLLLPGADSVGQPVVWRFSSQGARSLFFDVPVGFGPPATVTVGPDGDVWVPTSYWRDTTTLRLWRMSPQGAIKDTIDLTGVSGSRSAAFSPAGELYVSARGGVYKVVGRNAVQVIVTQNVIHELAFDRDGYLYAIAQPPRRDPTQPGDDRQFVKIMLFDPQYHIVSDPFANVPSAATVQPSGALLFGRSADGTMAARLFTLEESNITKFVELNANGIRAPGWPLGKQSSSSQPQISIADIANALMGGPALTTDQVQYLDTHGNHNGVLDVGDLRAYLRAQGKLSGSRRP
jgi:hypothetical protein